MSRQHYPSELLDFSIQFFKTRSFSGSRDRRREKDNFVGSTDSSQTPGASTGMEILLVLG